MRIALALLGAGVRAPGCACTCRRSIACCRLEPKRSIRRSRARGRRVGDGRGDVHGAVVAPGGQPLRVRSISSDRSSIAARLPSGLARASSRSKTAAGMGASSAARCRSSGADGEVRAVAEQDRVALCINSFSTPAGGVVLAAGRCRAPAPPPTSRQGRQGRGRPRRCGRSAAVDAGGSRARRRRGDLDRRRAVTRARRSTPTCCSGAASRMTRRAAVVRLQGDAARGGAAARSRLAPGRHASTSRSRRRSIGGRTARWSPRFPGDAGAERTIVLVAHVQEPGANDNASGAARCWPRRWHPRRDRAAARCRRRRGRSRSCGSTRFRGSEQWIKDDAAREAASSR